MSDDKKIKLWDLLQHVIVQRHRYTEPHLFDLGEGTANGSGRNKAWCKMVVDNLTNEIRETVNKMQEAAFCVLGLYLSVTVYTKNEIINATKEKERKNEN